MNEGQRDYLVKNYQSKSVKALASELGLDRKDIQRELRKMLAARAEKARPALPRWIHSLAVGAILVAILLIYGKSLSYPFLNWDDPQYVTENRLIRSFSRENLAEIFTRPHFSLYIPFTLLSYAADSSGRIRQRIVANKTGVASSLCSLASFLTLEAEPAL